MRNHATKDLHALGLEVCEQIILVLGAPNPLPHRGEAGWHPSGRERRGRLLAVLAALQRDQRTQRAPDTVGRKLERLAGGWGP